MPLGAAASWATKLAVRTICLIYTGRQACQDGSSSATKLAVRTICLIYTGRQACQEGFERRVKKNLLRRQEYNTVIV